MNAKLFQIRLLKCEKRGVLDRDPCRKPDSRTCECKALSERDSCMHVHFENARWSHAVRRSWSWLGRHLQCMWTHVVQIMIPITFWIAIRNVFRNVIRSHGNTAYVYSNQRCFWKEGKLYTYLVQNKWAAHGPRTLYAATWVTTLWRKFCGPTVVCVIS